MELFNSAIKKDRKVIHQLANTLYNYVKSAEDEEAVLEARKELQEGEINWILHKV